MRYAGQVRSGQVMTSLTAPPSPLNSPGDPGDLRLAGNLADGAVLLPPSSLPPSLPPSSLTANIEPCLYLQSQSVTVGVTVRLDMRRQESSQSPP